MHFIFRIRVSKLLKVFKTNYLVDCLSYNFSLLILQTRACFLKLCELCFYFEAVTIFYHILVDTLQFLFLKLQENANKTNSFKNTCSDV